MKDGIFESGDRIITDSEYGCSRQGTIVKYLGEGKYSVLIDDPKTVRMQTWNEYDLEYVNPKYYSLVEMSTVVAKEALNGDPAMHIEVNPDRHRSGNPYVKVLNTAKYEPGKSKVCRLHFLDSGMEYHTGEGLTTWRLRAKDLSAIRKLFMAKHPDVDHTNWQMACWLWNLEYGFFTDSTQREDYFSGKFDAENKDNPSYVPSTCEIPETWIYDKKKGIKKR